MKKYRNKRRFILRGKNLLFLLSASWLTASAANNDEVCGNDSFAVQGAIHDVRQQTEKITGFVVDAAGEPLTGVNVIVKGTATGTVTDIQGQFELNIPRGAEINISFIGYIDQTVKVESSRIRVILQENNKLLDELVVVGYGVQKKKLTTGSTIQIKGENIEKMSALQGQSPGVSIIQSSGQPGDGFKVSIRGLGTTGDYSPLIIIDGFAGGSIDNLNPADIESIDILKDAASASIYGSRASNGVILITTKKGSQGKNYVSYDGYFGIQSIAKTRWCCCKT